MRSPHSFVCRHSGTDFPRPPVDRGLPVPFSCLAAAFRLPRSPECGSICGRHAHQIRQDAGVCSMHAFRAPIGHLAALFILGVAIPGCSGKGDLATQTAPPPSRPTPAPKRPPRPNRNRPFRRPTRASTMTGRVHCRYRQGRHKSPWRPGDHQGPRGSAAFTSPAPSTAPAPSPRACTIDGTGTIDSDHCPRQHHHPRRHRSQRLTSRRRLRSLGYSMPRTVRPATRPSGGSRSAAAGPG